LFSLQTSIKTFTTLCSELKCFAPTHKQACQGHPKKKNEAFVSFI
jgi:hypothetical protein